LKGAFISLDGLDGVGKSTQCRLLAEWLRRRGLDVVECADPGSTAVGAVIRHLLLDHRHDITLACEMFLFMASRAQLTAEIIRPALSAGRVVVADRFLLANVVYQGHAGGLNAEQIWEIGHAATNGLEPDLTLVLDLPTAQAVARKGGPADRVESRDQDYQDRVRAGFLAEARLRPDRIKVIAADRSINEVHEQICREVLGVLEADPGT
jgi:dTMP kinase